MSVSDFKAFYFALRRLSSPVSPITPFMYMVRFGFSVVLVLFGFCRFVFWGIFVFRGWFLLFYYSFDFIQIQGTVAKN